MSPSAERSGEQTFEIDYLTKYVYDADVVDNINALRVRPADGGRQRVADFSIRISPEVRLSRHDDYFGTEVVEFEVARPHRQLAIDVRARVTTLPLPEPPAPDWGELRTEAYREAGAEFLLQADDVPGHPVLAELQRLAAAPDDPLSTLLYVTELIPERFEYRPGATYVDSPLTHLLEGNAGVCQDFVHLGLNLLRRRGIACRYVSGYMFTAPGSDRSAGEAARAVQGAESVEVETHAWIEALLPDPDGEPTWVGIDPTNRGLAGQRHVKIGHGRRYADVPPIKGVYRGVANSALEATVTMTLVDQRDPAPTRAADRAG